LQTYLKKADVILPAVAQNEETASLISNEMQKSMKSDAMFVSIIHKIYNHDLMLELAKEGRIYGYGFLGDNESPLSYEGNVLAYPEIAWATKESMEANAEMWVDALILAASGQYPNQVN
jgi:lactate dehydrogenase-like 2-hydroxyacid dehydrogenase